MYAWSFEPPIVAGIIALVAIYLACTGPLRQYFPGATPVPPKQQQTFLLGAFILFVALVSPMGILSDSYLLSVHMVQHILLALVAPPILLLGTPGWMVAPLVSYRPVLLVGRFLTSFLPAILIFNVVLLVWHAPQFYEQSLRDTHIHALQHVMFIVTAVITWWPIFSPLSTLPRLSVPLQILYLFFQAIPTTILGALLTFSADAWYPTYARAPRIWGMSALEDQQWAGLIMWYPGGIIYLGVLTARWFAWMHSDEDDDDAYDDDAYESSSAL